MNRTCRLALALAALSIASNASHAAVSFDAPFRSLQTGFLPTFIAAGDLDGDGRVDLVTTDRNRNVLSVLLCSGPRSYAARVEYPTITTPNCVYLADLDGDARLDAVIGSRTQVGVMLGNGDGSFGPVVPYATGTCQAGSRRRGAVRDFNEDGNPDFLVNNIGTQTMSLLLGNGDGTFDPWISVPLPVSSGGVQVARVNADAHWDMVTIYDNGFGNVVAVIPGHGDGTFGTTVVSTLGTNYPDFPNGLEFADLNGDGKLDAAIGYSTSTVGGPGKLGVSLGNGDGTFGPSSLQACGSGPLQVLARDFDEDGDLDLVAVNIPQSIGGTLSLFRGHGDGTFEAYQQQAGNNPRQAVVDDLDGDGRLDIAVVSESASNIALFHGNGDMTFGRQRSTPVTGGPQGLAVGDLDEDGNLDALGFIEGAPSSTLWSGSGDGLANIGPVVYDDTDDFSYFPELGRLDNDSHLDLVLAIDDKVRVSPGLGGGNFGSPVDYPAGPGLRELLLPDLDSDGALDAVLGNYDSGIVTLLKGLGDGTFAPPTTLATVAAPLRVMITRIDADADDDIAVVYAGSHILSLFLNQSDGTFQPRLDVVCDGLPGPLGDLDGDGLADVVTQRGSFPADSAQILLGNGDGSFTALAPQPVGLRAGAMEVLDLDGDHHADIAFDNGLGNSMHVAQGNGDGTFQLIGLGWGMGASPESKHFADLDGDGLPEVLSVNYYGKDLSILKNTSPIAAGVIGESIDGAIRSPIDLRGFAPNPAHGAPVVVFSTSRRGSARLEILDLAGRRVHERTLGVLEAGTHRVRWSEGAHATPGAYWVRVIHDGRAVTRKGVVLR